jgi:hypothetical protein
MKEQNQSCEWGGGCNSAATKHVRYNTSVSGFTGRVTNKGYELLAPPTPLNLCDLHISELRRHYSDVKEEPLDIA